MLALEHESNIEGKQLEADVQPLSDDELSQLANERFLELGSSEAVEAPQVCAKCGGRMQRGFFVDMGHGGARFVSSWAGGAPLKSLLFKTKKPVQTLALGAFRCSECGYVESYAREEFAPKRQETQYSLRSLLIFVTVVAVALGLIIWAVKS